MIIILSIFKTIFIILILPFLNSHCFGFRKSNNNNNILRQQQQQQQSTTPRTSSGQTLFFHNHHQQQHHHHHHHHDRKKIETILCEHPRGGAVIDEDMIYPQISLPMMNDDKGENEKIIQSTTQGLILIDGFCPYHSGYLSQKAQEVYNAGIVHTLSDYVIKCLIRDNDNSDDDDNDENDRDMNDQFLSARIPKSQQALNQWLESIPFEIKGIICESDSGLDDTEKLGVAIGLYPDRHDGINSKFMILVS